MEDKPSFPSEFQKRTLWKAVTGLAILILGALLVGLIWLGSTVLGYLQPVLVPLAVAGIIAYLLDPLVQWLQRKGFTRIKGIVTVFFGFLLFFGILFAFVGTKLSEQISELQVDEKSKFTEEQLVEAKQNKFYGRIVRHFLSKSPEAFQAQLDKKIPIQAPNDKILAKYNVSEEDLADITASAWNHQPFPKPVAPINKKDETEEYQESLALHQEKERLAFIESSLSRNNFWLTKGGAKLSTFLSSTLNWISNSYGKILGFLGILIGFAMVPIYLYYFLKEGDSIKNNWHDYVPLKASPFKNEVVETLAEINGYLISFFRGQVLVAFIDGILVGIALTLFGLNYGLLIGVVMALLGIIPYIGNILCLIPACIIAAIQGSSEPWGLPQWGYVLSVVAIFVVVQQINSLITAPKIVGDSVGLHPMSVIFSMLFWSLLLGGLLGALLAVPLTAAVKVLFRRYVWDRQATANSPKPQALPSAS